MPFLIRIARKSAWVLVVAMIIALFSGLILVKFPLFPMVNYGLVREIHVFFILIVLIPVFYLHTLGGMMTLLKRRGLDNKKILTVSVILGWTAVFLVFGMVYFSTVPSASATSTAIPVPGSPGVLLTPAEVANHNSAGSCWVIIGGKVYDLTSYILIHPGGAGQILPSCGKDRTVAYATKNSGVPHSPYAISLLNAFYIGDSGTAMTRAPLPAGTTRTVPPTESAIPVTPVPGGTVVALTPAEVANHNSAGSCWVIISGKVYDLTGYIGSHPGGAGQILQSCGKDGTTAYATKNSGVPHSSYAVSLLNAYYIGDTGAAVTLTPLPSGTPVAVPRQGGERDDD